MARVTSPLLSLTASGSVGKAIVFSRWKGRAYVRELVKPHNPKSGLQVGMRSALKFVSQSYKNIGATPQANWKAAAKAKNITPLDQMVKQNQTRARQGLGMLKDPTNAAGAVEAAPTAGAAAAQPTSLVVTWVDSAGANDWGTYVYMSTTNAFTPGPATLVAIVAHGVQTITMPKLKTGTAYYFRLAGTETGGTLGTLAAQFTGTPT